jgi:hypothetical protein
MYCCILLAHRTVCVLLAMLGCSTCHVELFRHHHLHKASFLLLLLCDCTANTTARQHDGSKRTGSSTARAATATAPTYGTTEETSPTVNQAAGASHFGDSPQKGPTAPVTMTDQEHILHELQFGTADLEEVHSSSSCCSLQLCFCTFFFDRRFSLLFTHVA